MVNLKDLHLVEKYCDEQKKAWKENFDRSIILFDSIDNSIKTEGRLWEKVFYRQAEPMLFG